MNNVNSHHLQLHAPTAANQEELSLLRQRLILAEQAIRQQNEQANAKDVEGEHQRNVLGRSNSAPSKSSISSILHLVRELPTLSKDSTTALEIFMNRVIIAVDLAGLPTDHPKIISAVLSKIEAPQASSNISLARATLVKGSPEWLKAGFHQLDDLLSALSDWNDPNPRDSCIKRLDGCTQGKGSVISYIGRFTVLASEYVRLFKASNQSVFMTARYFMKGLEDKCAEFVTGHLNGDSTWQAMAVSARAYHGLLHRHQAPLRTGGPSRSYTAPMDLNILKEEEEEGNINSRQSRGGYRPQPPPPRAPHDKRVIPQAIQNPDTQNPDTQNPETLNPDTQNPDTQPPEPQNPETQNPETLNPDTQNPDTQNPETQNPETQNPEP
jgi:hypothetical protein